MNGRGMVTVCFAVLLLFGVVFGQILLYNISADLADSAEEICALIGDEKTEEGLDKLKDLSDCFYRRKKIL